MAEKEINALAESRKSELIQNINKGLSAGIISLNRDQSKITYHCYRDYTTSFKNPEEKVRASYFSELVLSYQYPVKKNKS